MVNVGLWYSMVDDDDDDTEWVWIWVVQICSGENSVQQSFSGGRGSC
jgi:hypothetical protein